MRLLNLNICIKLDNNDKVIELIKQEKPDICTFQEAMNGTEQSCFEMYQSKNKLVEIQEYPFYEFAPLFIAKGVSKDGVITRDFGGKAEQGSLILSKYDICEHYNQFYYNEYRYEYDATNFREKDWCRSIQNAIFNIKDKKVQIINVHGIWNRDKLGDERTVAQSEFILSQMRGDIACIVLGDFNLLPNTQSIQMINHKMKNLIDICNIKSTRPNFNDVLDKGNVVCDYIFVNDKIKVNDFKVIQSNASDHLPLLLDFEIL